MTRSELIHRIAQKQSQIIERDVELAVKMMLEQMAASLAGGGRIEIRAFGSFSLRLRPARVARNPRTGTPVSLPARSAPNFKPGKRLRERVNREDRGVADDTDGAGIIAIRGRANTRVTSRQIRHARAIRAFMSRSKRP